MQDNKHQAKVQYLTITANQAGQRIDNFFITYLKGVPKSRIYRILRKGEVRVNKKRIAADYRLQLGDIVRVPPIRLEEKPPIAPGSRQIQSLNDSILYEDDELLIINKPAGLAVHAGSDVQLGVIEILRHMRPKQSFLELVHRLDKATSGCLMLAKSRDILLYLHSALQEHNIIKRYQAIVQGYWPDKLTRVNLPLEVRGIRVGGERKVIVEKHQGKTALTEFKVLKHFSRHTLIEACLHTGRTHQIRVHTAESGYPIVGDAKYGKREADRAAKNLGAKGMYLHSAILTIPLPYLNKPLVINAPLPAQWQDFMNNL